MKRFSADYIFPGNSSPIKNGVIEVDEKGQILNLLNPAKEAIDWEEVEVFEGIICPGFVNTHCHLELSYLKGKIAEGNKLTGFIKEIVNVRDQFAEEVRMKSIGEAEQEMWKNGIVAVGDICNGDSTLDTKQKSAIVFHSFIEVFGTNTSVADEAIAKAVELKQNFDNDRVTIVPHAPYSLSPKLVEKVIELNEGLMSIHNQETASENEMFEKGSGELLQSMQNFAPEMKGFSPTNKSSLQSYLPKYASTERMLLVHNTFTSAQDISFTKTSPIAIYWCFCPNANKYIEGRQPDYTLFLAEKCTIGTDSLASNWSLSILDELKTIRQKNMQIELETLLKWATINGAEALGLTDKLGSIEVGKAPGLNLISDLIDANISEKSTVKKIV